MPLRLGSSYWAVTISMRLVGVLATGPITHLASQQTNEYGYYHRRQDTSTVSTCAGLTSYFACPLELGGGCCPQGLICGTNQACSPSPTTSTTTTVFCDQGWFACPSSYGGGCCLGGGICGPGVCTFYAPATTTITSASSGGQTGSVTSTLSETLISSQIDPTITSLLSTEVSGTETVSRLFTTTTIITGGGSGGLSGGQIGGISAGVVVGLLLLVAVGWLIVRHLVRISRFMDRFDNAQGAPDKPTVKEGEPHTRDTELSVVDDNNVGSGQTMTELSPQERPQLLEEWGRHGSRGNELPGSCTAHGVSELDSSTVARN